MIQRNDQHGTTTIEFAIVGALFMVLMFGVIEIARAFFVWNTIAETTRRGARVAAVCPVNHSAVTQIALFNAPGTSGDSSILPNLTPSNIHVSYLSSSGTDTTSYPQIASVRVEISNYQHRLMIPFFEQYLTVPPFSTTLPAESLGYVPELASRQCFGS